MSNISNPETEFFSLDKVRVTNARFVVNDKTYVMSNVTSVVYDRKEPSVFGNTVLALGSVLLVFLGILIAIKGELAGAAVCILIGLFCIVLSQILLKKLEAKHFVVLQTSSGAVQALESPDEAYIKQVVDALNNAIIHRG